MTEEQKLTAMALSFSLTAIGLQVDAALALVGTILAPKEELRREMLREAKDLAERACETADEASRLADRANEIWRADRYDWEEARDEA